VLESYPQTNLRQVFTGSGSTSTGWELGICPNQSMKTKLRRIEESSKTGTFYFPEKAGALARIFEEAAGF